MHENRDCFKFHGFTLTLIFGPVFTFALNNYQIAGGHFIGKKNNNFWAVGKCRNIDCQVSCWQNKMTIGRLAASVLTANKIGRSENKTMTTFSSHENEVTPGVVMTGVIRSISRR